MEVGFIKDGLKGGAVGADLVLVGWELMSIAACLEPEDIRAVLVLGKVMNLGLWDPI